MNLSEKIMLFGNYIPVVPDYSFSIIIQFYKQNNRFLYNEF